MDNWQSYLYPNGVLKNKLGIKDLNSLTKEEYKLTHIKYVHLLKSPENKILSWTNYKDLHLEMFKDIYDWAGKTRTVDMRKDADSAFFTSYKEINKNGEELFYQLKRSNYLEEYNNDLNLFCDNLAYFINRLNRLHPFREGNGRTQKLLGEYLCMINGYSINYNDISPDEWNSAFREGEYAFTERLSNLFKKNINRISLIEQNFYRKAFGLREIEKEMEKNDDHDFDLGL